MHEGFGFQHCHITDLKAVLALYGSTSNGHCTHYRSIFNHCDIIDLQSYRIRWKKTQNTGYYAVQGHRGRCQSNARMRLPVSD